jgi:predicted secreted hydrolase
MRSWLSLLVLLVTACDNTPPASEAVVRVAQVMGAEPDPGFARALEPRTFTFPRDHGAHPEYAIEWWYLTGNLQTDSGRRFGYQFTLFRVGLRPGEPDSDSAWRTRQVYMGHLAISDAKEARHHSAERFSRAAAGLAGCQITPFSVWLGPWSLQADSAFDTLNIEAGTDAIGLQLQLQASASPLVLQGDRGLSRKSAAPGNASYYYSLTRLPTRGELRIGEVRYTVTGHSWMDREWSSSALDRDQVGWDWFALQLDDGRDLMYYQLRDTKGDTDPFSRGSLIGPDGRVQALLPGQVNLVPMRHWQANDGTRYPVSWRLQVREPELDLTVSALLDDQRMDHSVRYWEGAVEVSGSHTGRGYLELSGYATSE